MRRRFFLGVESLGQRLTLDGSIGIAAALPDAPPADVAPLVHGMINPLISPTDDGSPPRPSDIPPPCNPMDPNWKMIRDDVRPLYDPMRVLASLKTLQINKHVRLNPNRFLGKDCTRKNIPYFYGHLENLREFSDDFVDKPLFTRVALSLV